MTQNTDLIVFPVSFHKKSSLHLLIAPASASSAFVRTKARTRMALQICRTCSACWDAIPIPANITFRDGCTLLRSAERAFCKNAKPASARCRTMGLGCAQQASCNASGLCIYKDTACRYNVIDETKTVSSKTVIWLCRFPKHSNIEVRTGAESGKTACLVSIQELLTA